MISPELEMYNRESLMMALENTGWTQVESDVPEMIAFQKGKITWFLSPTFDPGDIYRMIEHEVMNRDPIRAGC